MNKTRQESTVLPRRARDPVPRKAGTRPRTKKTSLSGQPVLLVMAAASRPRIALLRAFAFAKRLSVPLYVVGYLPPSERCNVLFPEKNVRDITRKWTEEGLAASRLGRWCDKVLPRPLSSDRIIVQRGNLAASGVSLAGKLQAQLVVVPSAEVKNGLDVTAMVEDTGISVLVSRPVQPRNAVIAATDLSTERIPVLRQGLATAEVLGAPVTFVHNVVPAAHLDLLQGGDGLVYLPLHVVLTKEVQKQRKSKMQAIADSMGGGIDAEVVSDIDTVAAILKVAVAQQADLIIVGHRHRAWLDGVFGKNTASQVVDRALRSVMIVPFPKSDRAGTRGKIQ